MNTFGLFLAIEEANEIIAETKEERFIDPITGKKWRFPDRWRQLEAIIQDEVSKGTHPNRIWISFTNVPRKTAYPWAGEHGAPHALYGFPATYAIKKKEKLEYGTNRPYILVFKVKGPIISAEKYGPHLKKFRRNISYLYDELRKNKFSTHAGIVRNEITEIAHEKIEKSKVADKTGLRIFVHKLIYELFDDLVYRADNPFVEEIIKRFNVKKVIGEYFKKLKNYVLRLLIWKTIQPFSQNRKYTITKTPNFDDSNADIDDYFVVKISPEFEEEIKNNPEKWKLYQEFLNQPNIPLTKLMEIEDDDGLVRTIKNLKNHLALSKTNVFKKLIPIIMKKAKNRLAEFDSKREIETKFPFYRKFKEIAKKYNLDLHDALNSTTYRDTPFKFVYRLAEELAKQYVVKRGRSAKEPVVWAKFIRELGIPSLSDPLGTESIHTAEATQGAFLDPRNVEVIDVILNKPHISSRIVAGAPPYATKEEIYSAWRKRGYSHEDALDKAKEGRTPESTGWYSKKGTGIHRMRRPPSMQRTTSVTASQELMGKTNIDRTLIGINGAIRLIVNSPLITYGEVENKDNANAFAQSLVNLLKLVKSAQNIKRRGGESEYFEKIEDSYHQILSKVLIPLENQLKTANIDPERKKELETRINILLRAISKEKFESPQFKRLRATKPVLLQNYDDYTSYNPFV